MQRIPHPALIGKALLALLLIGNVLAHPLFHRLPAGAVAVQPDQSDSKPLPTDGTQCWLCQTGQSLFETSPASVHGEPLTAYLELAMPDAAPSSAEPFASLPVRAPPQA